MGSRNVSRIEEWVHLFSIKINGEPNFNCLRFSFHLVGMAYHRSQIAPKVDRIPTGANRQASKTRASQIRKISKTIHVLESKAVRSGKTQRRRCLRELWDNSFKIVSCFGSLSLQINELVAEACLEIGVLTRNLNLKLKLKVTVGPRSSRRIYQSSLSPSMAVH